MEETEEDLSVFRIHDKHMSRRGLVEFYAGLLKAGKISVNGAGHHRMRDLMSKIEAMRLKTSTLKYLTIK